jgi:hypothetical protein
MGCSSLGYHRYHRWIKSQNITRVGWAAWIFGLDLGGNLMGNRLDLKTKELLYASAYVHLSMLFVHVHFVFICFRENCGWTCQLYLVFSRLLWLWLLLEETCPSDTLVASKKSGKPWRKRRCNCELEFAEG